MHPKLNHTHTHIKNPCKCHVNQAMNNCRICLCPINFEMNNFPLGKCISIIILVMQNHT